VPHDLRERIRLRRNERSDIPKFVEWLNDPDIRRYLLINLPISQANEEQWFENTLNCPPTNNPSALKSARMDPQGRKVWRLLAIAAS